MSVRWSVCWSVGNAFVGGNRQYSERLLSCIRTCYGFVRRQAIQRPQRPPREKMTPKSKSGELKDFLSGKANSTSNHSLQSPFDIFCEVNVNSVTTMPLGNCHHSWSRFHPQAWRPTMILLIEKLFLMIYVYSLYFLCWGRREEEEEQQ